MNIENENDVKDMAIKLDEILNKAPTDYYFLKGYIHCLWQKENVGLNEPKELAAK